MQTPKITWYVLEEINGDYEFSPKRTHDVDGAYAPNETLALKVQVWNNRSGDADVQDAIDSRLSIYFKDYEDNYMLNLCKIKIDNTIEDLTIDIDRGIFNLGTIFGNSNNGSDLNVNNFKEFELIIGPFPSNLRSEYKGLIMDLEC